MMYVWFAVLLIPAILLMVLPLRKSLVTRGKDEAAVAEELIKEEQLKQEQVKQSIVESYRRQEAVIQSELADKLITQEQADARIEELKLKLLEDSEFKLVEQWQSHKPGKIIFASIFLLIGAAFWVYSQYGASNLLEIRSQLQQFAEGKMDNGEQLKLIENLKRESEKDDREEISYLLAQLQFELGKFQASADEFAELYKKLPEDRTEDRAAILAQWAQSEFLANDRKMTDSIQQRIEASLTLQPNQTIALGMMGIYKYENGKYREAIGYWQQLVQATGGQNAAAIQAGIDRAISELQKQGENVEELLPKKRSIKVSVELSKALVSRAEKDDLLFVVARGKNTPPLAVSRVLVGQLPMEVELNESMAMLPGMTIANFDDVELIARISKSGQPQAQPGDLEGRAQVKIKDQGEYQLVINQIL